VVIKEFIGTDKTRAVRKAFNFWYKEYKELPLKQFLCLCTWRKENKNKVIVTFKGSSPK